ncbi:hypothetical protein DPMN_035281 [Dreissena polymorpha]|uniref:Uncharacterized protein n=1 Tax=Dreissena polymorpha TaxID=45954 RepID=A0A9D4RLS1_DREPO|nr:hypothetical protein DPMN_035281 [Dreissena polymorpha]
MEDSISSSSYSFSDHSMEDDINPVCTCKLTKVTYSQDQSFTHISEMKKAIISKHRQLDRSQSEPVLRLSDRDDNESAGLEPNCDLFGIQLECWNRILKAFANSLDPDETPQNVASHLDPNSILLTPASAFPFPLAEKAAAEVEAVGQMGRTLGRETARNLRWWPYKDKQDNSTQYAQHAGQTVLRFGSMACGI